MPESADEITVIAHFTATGGHERELLSLLHGMVGPTRGEEGCLRYELNQEIDNPRSFAFVERFRSVSAYEAHLASKHVRRFSERSADMVESRTVRLHRELLPRAEGSASVPAGDEAGVVVIAHFKAKPGGEQELSALLQELVAPTRAEPGCLRYELSQDLHDAATFSFVEMYADQRAFDAHCDQPYIRNLFGVLSALAEEQYVGVHRQVLALS